MLYLTGDEPNGKFEIDIALPSYRRFEIVDLHDVQISLFQGDEIGGTKLAEINQKFPENLGMRNEPEETDGKNNGDLVEDVYSFRVDDDLKKYTGEVVQEKFELAGESTNNFANMCVLIPFFSETT